MEVPPPQLLDLPDELLLVVISHLPQEALISMLQVCRRLQALTVSSVTQWVVGTEGIAVFSFIAKWFPNIKTLDCGQCQALIGKDFMHVIRLANLQSLNLSSAFRLTSAQLATLGDCTKLVHLDLSYCAVGNNTLHSIGRLPHLRHLLLNGCQAFDSAGLFGLSGLTRLESLSMFRCRQVAGMAGLSPLVELRTFNLEGCYELTSLEGLEGLTNLHTLNARQCYKLENSAILLLPPSLRTLQLAGCDRISDLDALLSNHQLLERLNLRGCRRITDDCLVSVSRLAYLQELNLAGLETITDVGLAALSTVCTLRAVTLRLCSSITSTGVASFLIGRSALRNVDLNMCKQVGDDVVAAMAGLPELRYVRLRWTAITDSGLQALASDPPPNLQLLNIEDCKQITDASLSALHAVITLRHLYLAGCPLVSEECITTLKRNPTFLSEKGKSLLSCHWRIVEKFLWPEIA